tara:strand:+ start:1143 stop:1376 length:234 start_codon:yes stop_codon:yes gene_type:complete
LIHAINSGGNMGKVEEAINKMVAELMFIGLSQDKAIEMIHSDIDKAKAEIDKYWENVEIEIDNYIESQVDCRVEGVK